MSTLQGLFKSKPNIIYTGTISDYGGYASMNRTYITELIRHGYNIKLDRIKSTIDIPLDEYCMYQSLMNYNSHTQTVDTWKDPEAIRIVSHLPLKSVPKSKKLISYTMSESRTIGQWFIESLADYDEIWTPSEYYTNVFKERTGKPSFTLPIPIDPALFKQVDSNYIEQNFKYSIYSYSPITSSVPTGFRFLYVSRYSYRKGFDVLLKAFLREFTRKDDVSLVLFSRHAAMSQEPRYRDQVQAELYELYRDNGCGQSPAVYWCSDMVGQVNLRDVYKQGDCYVCTSRGEGFSLPTLEASVCGLPCIAPLHTAFTDYISTETAYPFNVDEWKVCNRSASWDNWVTPHFSGQAFPVFGESVIKQVQALMRQVYNNHQEAKDKNRNLQQLIRDRYTVEKCFAQMEKLINE